MKKKEFLLFILMIIIFAISLKTSDMLVEIFVAKSEDPTSILPYLKASFVGVIPVVITWITFEYLYKKRKKATTYPFSVENDDDKNEALQK